MIAALDANLLLYASDAGSPFSAQARSFLAERAASSEITCLAWSTVMAYLRIATHPGIFTHPLTPAEATSNVDQFLSLPHARLLREEDGFWEVYREVTASLPVRGNLVPDAHLAALLKQHGVKTLYSADADFRKFRFLRVQNPLR